MGRKLVHHQVAARPRAGTDFGGDPAIRMMERKVPRARSAERKPPQHEARIVDLETALDGGRRFEHVDLAGPVIGVVAAREHFELKLTGVPDAGGRGIGRRLQTRSGRMREQPLARLRVGGRRVVTNPVALDQPLRSAVQHDVEARRFSVIARRNGEQQRLNGPIERRIKAERDLALLRRPGGLSVLKLLRALDAAIEHLERERHVVLHRDILRKFENPVPGLGVNLDVGDEIDLLPASLSARAPADRARRAFACSAWRSCAVIS